MMNHTQPTSTAHLSDSAPACSERAGRHPGSLEAEAQIRALLADDRAQDVGFYLDHFSQGERNELAAAARKTLDAEVVMLRAAMKQFFLAVRTDENPETIEKLGEALNLLGLSCSRLGNVLKINQALQGAAKSAGQNALLEKLMDELSQITPDAEENCAG